MRATGWLCTREVFRDDDLILPDSGVSSSKLNKVARKGILAIVPLSTDFSYSIKRWCLFVFSQGKVAAAS